MKLFPIITNRTTLEKPCSITSKDEGLKIGQILVEQLKLRRDTAVGLAANQIGIDARVFAMVDNQGYKFFVNPEIIEKINPFVFQNEGCLSVPGKRFNTVRFNKIIAKDDFNDKIVLENFAAVIFEHEKNHLDGILLDEKEYGPYNVCICGSGKKMKFCCLR